MGKVTYSQKITPPLKYIGLTLFGLVVTLNVLIYSIISIPLLIYRIIVCYLITPLYRPHVARIVPVMGHAFATEFQKDKSYIAPRCAIVTCFVTEGTVTKAEVEDVVKRKWIEAKEPKSHQLRFPEFQQYIEQWMGFMFWKQDQKFSLDNHIHVHKIEDSVSPSGSKVYLDEILELLINKPFTPKRSPWEIHLIHNYRDPELIEKSKEKKMTCFIFRTHHSFADGFSIFSLLCEELGSMPLSQSKFAQPLKLDKARSSPIWDLVKLPVEVLHDLGTIFIPTFTEKNPWYVPDESKKWRQIYRRSPLIPIDKVKFIKNQLGCTFSGVIMSSIASGIAQSFKDKGSKGFESIPFGIAVPLPGHPKKLINHLTGTICDLPTEYGIDSLERLRRTERCLKVAKESHMPVLYRLLQRIISFQVAPLARYLFANRVLATGLSSFPGPNVPLKLGDTGKDILTCHFSAGALPGIAGAGLMLLSFQDHLYIAANVEAALMGREEVDELIQRICDEIDLYYGLALKTKKN